MKDNELFTFKLVEDYTPPQSERMKLLADGRLWVQFEGRMYEATPRHQGVVEAITKQAYEILNGRRRND